MKFDLENFTFKLKSLPLILGKSLICKEKWIQADEKERNLVNEGLKSSADPSIFISMVGVNGWGNVDEHEHLFDIFLNYLTFCF